MIDLVISQLTDIFRVGLIVGLVITMRRTSAVTGRLLPLALGVVFVAVILPTTLPSNAAGLGDAIAAGLVTNTVILGLVLAVEAVLQRLRR